MLKNAKNDKSSNNLTF